MSAPVAVSIIAGSLAIGIPVVGAATSLETRHRVAGVADNAALAAADALLGWVESDPCDAALLITSSADVNLDTCLVHPASVTVTVSAHGVLGTIALTSRAGVLLDAFS